VKHVVQFSFGESSWYTARRVAIRHGTDDLILLFADTKSEDEDTYRWGRAAAADIGGALVEVADGRDIWELFNDEGLIGNTRADVCSRVLKRELCRKWVEDNFPDPSAVTLYVGIHWSEADRLESIRRNWQPYRVESPLCERPLVPHSEIRAAALADGLGTQRLYQLGFKHANCGGACVKGGQAQWAHLLRTLPERYAFHEAKEREFREKVGKDVAILRDRRGGETRPLTLEAFRRRVEAGGECDLFDWGACNCFAPPGEDKP
jgi:hypothetical protein